MRNSDFQYTDFHGSNFDDADLREANLQYCVAFTGKNEGTNWRGTGFTKASFRGSNLTEANFTGATLSGVDFVGAKLKGSNFTKASLLWKRNDKRADRRKQINEGTSRTNHSNVI